jgi:hypothetical protein
MRSTFLGRAAASLGTVLILGACLPLSAHATENEAFGISPYPDRVNGVARRTFAIPLDAGVVFSDAVRLYNRTDQPMELEVYPSDARAALDGTISVGFRGSSLTGVGSWIKLSRSSVSLAARASAVVTFRVSVHSTKPSPELGAIVADNSTHSLRPDLVRRVHVVVRTTPPGSPTSSTKVRAFTLLSGWTIVAVGGLIAAGALVWLARRRARRSREEVEPADAQARAEDDTPEASRPVLHRFGRTDTEPKLISLGTDAETRRRTPRRRPLERDERPLLDEVAFIEDTDLEDDETDEVELPRPKAARTTRRATSPKPPPRKPAPKKTPPDDDDKKLDYIPLDDL